MESATSTKAIPVNSRDPRIRKTRVSDQSLDGKSSSQGTSHTNNSNSNSNSNLTNNDGLENNNLNSSNSDPSKDNQNNSIVDKTAPKPDPWITRRPANPGNYGMTPVPSTAPRHSSPLSVPEQGTAVHSGTTTSIPTSTSATTTTTTTTTGARSSWAPSSHLLGHINPPIPDPRTRSPPRSRGSHSSRPTRSPPPPPPPPAASRPYSSHSARSNLNEDNILPPPSSHGSFDLRKKETEVERKKRIDAEYAKFRRPGIGQTSLSPVNSLSSSSVTATKGSSRGGGGDGSSSSSSYKHNGNHRDKDHDNTGREDRSRNHTLQSTRQANMGLEFSPAAARQAAIQASRSKSRGPRSRSRSRARANWDRTKDDRGQSKSRKARERSTSRKSSRSKSMSRGRSRDRSMSRGRSRGRSTSRGRSRGKSSNRESVRVKNGKDFYTPSHPTRSQSRSSRRQPSLSPARAGRKSLSPRGMGRGMGRGYFPDHSREQSPIRGRGRDRGPSRGQREKDIVNHNANDNDYYHDRQHHHHNNSSNYSTEDFSGHAAAAMRSRSRVAGSRVVEMGGPSLIVPQKRDASTEAELSTGNESDKARGFGRTATKAARLDSFYARTPSSTSSSFVASAALLQPNDSDAPMPLATPIAVARKSVQEFSLSEDEDDDDDDNASDTPLGLRVQKQRQRQEKMDLLRNTFEISSNSSVGESDSDHGDVAGRQKVTVMPSSRANFDSDPSVRLRGVMTDLLAKVNADIATFSDLRRKMNRTFKSMQTNSRKLEAEFEELKHEVWLSNTRHQQQVSTPTTSLPPQLQQRFDQSRSSSPMSVTVDPGMLPQPPPQPSSLPSTTEAHVPAPSTPSLSAPPVSVPAILTPSLAPVSVFPSPVQQQQQQQQPQTQPLVRMQPPPGLKFVTVTPGSLTPKSARARTKKSSRQSPQSPQVQVAPALPSSTPVVSTTSATTTTPSKSTFSTTTTSVPANSSQPSKQVDASLVRVKQEAIDAAPQLSEKRSSPPTTTTTTATSRTLPGSSVSKPSNTPAPVTLATSTTPPPAFTPAAAISAVAAAAAAAAVAAAAPEVPPSPLLSSVSSPATSNVSTTASLTIQSAAGTTSGQVVKEENKKDFKAQNSRLVQQILKEPLEMEKQPLPTPLWTGNQRILMANPFGEEYDLPWLRQPQRTVLKIHNLISKTKTSTQQSRLMVVNKFAVGTVFEDVMAVCCLTGEVQFWDTLSCTLLGVIDHEHLFLDSYVETMTWVAQDVLVLVGFVPPDGETTKVSTGGGQPVKNDTQPPQKYQTILIQLVASKEPLTGGTRISWKINSIDANPHQKTISAITPALQPSQSISYITAGLDRDVYQWKFRPRIETNQGDTIFPGESVGAVHSRLHGHTTPKVTALEYNHTNRILYSGGHDQRLIGFEIEKRCKIIDLPILGAGFVDRLEKVNQKQSWMMGLLPGAVYTSKIPLCPIGHIVQNPMDSRLLMITTMSKQNQYLLYDERTPTEFVFSMSTNTVLQNPLSRHVVPTWHPEGGLWCSGDVSMGGKIQVWDIRWHRTGMMTSIEESSSSSSSSAPKSTSTTMTQLMGLPSGEIRVPTKKVVQVQFHPLARRKLMCLGVDSSGSSVTFADWTTTYDL